LYNYRFIVLHQITSSYKGKGRSQEERIAPYVKTEILCLTADVCRLPAGPGPCTSYVNQWYFNSQNQTCKQFVYGGCGGNENRFQTREDCHRKCSHTGRLSTLYCD